MDVRNWQKFVLEFAILNIKGYDYPKKGARMFLSKSDYMMAQNCVKALWLKKNRKDLTPEIDEATQRLFDIGNEVQDLAREFFPGGVMVPAENWNVINGSKITAELAKSNDILYEAFAKLDNGAFCRIDVLKRNGGGWDLIEIKSATSVKPEYIADLAFQKYVFDNAGYPVKQCWVLHINSDYVCKGLIDVKELFQIEDMTDAVAEAYINTPAYAEQYMKIQTSKTEPEITIHKTCKDCPYYHYCCKDVPEYSVFDLLPQKEADVFYATTGKLEIKDVPESTCTTPKQLIDREAFLTNEIHAESEEIKAWLDKLEYPLYYLDYETFQTAVHMFDGCTPYGQTPFQFSLHIQKERGGKLEHISFLHKEQSDPRRALVECLIKNCGNKGSIVVYNESFEKSRNKELADLFPDLSDKLLAINERIVDQLVPFRNRYLYGPTQHSSASIKKTLPAFTDLSYSDMEVHNGVEASTRYEAFITGKLTDAEAQVLFNGLEKYCGQDTYAMVLLMDVLYKYSNS